jgi:hypothetical protein
VKAGRPREPGGYSDDTNGYMREYMKQQRAKKRAEAGLPERATGARGPGEKPFSEVTAEAAYVPRRDPPLRWSSPAAEALGDPPIGRSALDKCAR